MVTRINSPIQLTLMSGCEASRDAVALEIGSTAVGLVKSLETCSCIWANTGLAAVAHVWLHWVRLLDEGLMGGFSKVFNHLIIKTISAEDS